MILYDIEADAPRTKLAKWLDAEGFDRIQYSVFLGPITPHRWRRLAPRLEAFFQAHCAPTDRIYALVLDPRHFRQMLVLGEALDVEWMLGGPKLWFP